MNGAMQASKIVVQKWRAGIGCRRFMMLLMILGEQGERECGEQQRDTA